MITGRYGDTTGKPYIEGRLIIPSQSISTNISFLMDTGADMTVLMPMDGAKMGIDYAKFNDVVQVVGAGGYCNNFIDDAVAIFLDGPDRICIYGIKILISSPSPDLIDTPSLLGRNIIDRWRINYDPTNKILEAEVRSADGFAPSTAP